MRLWGSRLREGKIEIISRIAKMVKG